MSEKSKKRKFTAFSEKQMKALCWWMPESPLRNYDAIICDGAVRSGKTLCMSVSFVAWAFSAFSDCSFAMCGKTIASLRRNVVTVILPLLRELGFDCCEKYSQNLIEISCGGAKNRFYLFGGKDEGSAALIQGMTLAGVLLDEVTLMPRSFVEQALARCSVDGSKFWFNCNPEHPMHWFHEEWIKNHGEKNCLYLHFTMKDNPSLAPSIIRRYERMYSGAFYERFVLGRWVAAQGCVYPMFSAQKHIVTPPERFDRYYISCDYGTVNPASFGLWGRQNGVWYRTDEFYFDSRREGRQMTDAEYAGKLRQLAGGRTIREVIVDPSAASFIEVLRREGWKVRKADNDVLSGIRRTADALRSGRIVICDRCTDCLREMELYVWDLAAGGDRVVKKNDHAMDDMRYFVTGVLGSGTAFAVRAPERKI